MIGIPCNSCANGFCGNCSAQKLENTGFIRSAKFHCICANSGHKNEKSKDMPNKAIFSKKKDEEPHSFGKIQGDADDDFRDDE